MMDDAYDKRLAYIQEHWTDEQGVLNADRIQQDLSRIFQIMLLFREVDVQTVDDVVEDFVRRFSHWLIWLGSLRQDQMLREAQKSTGVDLSCWLERE